MPHSTLAEALTGKCVELGQWLDLIQTGICYEEKAPKWPGAWVNGALSGGAVSARLIANSAIEAFTPRAFQDERLPSDGGLKLLSGLSEVSEPPS